MARILNGVARTRGKEAGGRTRSRGSLSFFLSFYGRSCLPDLRLSRLLRAFIGQQARRLPARPDISAAGRDYSPPLISATHPETRSPNEKLRTRTERYERRRERENVRYSVIQAGPRSCGCWDAAHRIYRFVCCDCCMSFAMINGGCR